MNVIAKPQVRLQLFNFKRPMPLCNGFNFLRIHLNAMSADNMVYIVQFVFLEMTLSHLGIKVILS